MSNLIVTPLDCLICEGCTRQLNSSEQFSILVKAAFPSHPSDESDLSVASTTTCVEVEASQTEVETLTIKPPTVMKDSQETFRELPRPKKVVKEKKLPAPVAKKINVTCNTCKQRYPKLSLGAGSVEDFTCSRCKYRPVKRKPESLAPSTRVNNEKGDFRKKPKLLKDTPKTLTAKPPKKCASVIKYHCEPRKYECSQCAQKFLFAQRLAEHVKSVHRDTLDNTCLVCARVFKTQSILEKHLKIHTVPVLMVLRALLQDYIHAHRHEEVEGGAAKSTA
ncbi:hypothetical protein MSG28_012460 [Choristoneura fumiferana]|uniref:Uncharacterized protein n=1 Tax=Choristoneura fumiferana TaxID=7141 RepID=A0ACC0KDN8_CHOFU|nr:hypothetical protein MSG28_012460 [Choristoneura fumiferana]